MAQFIPADHSKGDANTIGGYAAAHGRPAAFEGSDGMSYSVQLVADRTGDPERPWGAFLLFLRWRRIGAQGVEAHLETGFLAHGDSDREALDRLGASPLSDVRAYLEAQLAEERAARAAEAAATGEQAAEAGVPARRWWDVMKDEGSP